MKNVNGFSAIEMVLAITIVGLLTAMVVSPIRNSMDKEAVRGARLAVTTHLARARGAASTRGCFAVMHTYHNQVWVTACATNQAGVIDTVGSVDDLGVRYETKFVSTRDSVIFAPTGMMTSTGTLKIWFIRSDVRDSLGVSPTGRLLW